jgi:hypothetical protein
VSFVTLISFFVGKQGLTPEGGFGGHEEELLGSFLSYLLCTIITFIIIYFKLCYSTWALDTTSRATDGTDFIDQVRTD